MNMKYKTSELIEYIQDLCYTSEDRLKIDEIKDRLLELEKIKKNEVKLLCIGIRKDK